MESKLESVKSSLKGDIQIFSLNGRLTYDYISDLKTEIADSIVEAKGYVLDLSTVQQIDSTGMGMIVNIAKYITKDSELVIVNSDEFLQELFEVSKLNTIFNIQKSLADALNCFSENSDEYWNKVRSY